jgi:hypothetical protein
MRLGFVVLSLAAAAVVCVPALAQQWPDPPGPGAQQWPDAPKAQPKAKPKATPRRPPPDDVEELTPGQIERAQEPDPPPGKSKAQPKTAAPSSGPPPRTVACSGAFARDSSHIRLAQVFGSNNVVFDEVDGPDSSRLPASILFPKDPARRLEVLWNNQTSRSGTQLVVINGRSNWSAPRGLKLGLQLAALEKINGKAFKLTGFAQDGSTVAGWEGGAMAKLAGGCKVGLRVVADRRAPQDALSKVAAAKELMSNDAGVRALRATVAEILIGY